MTDRRINVVNLLDDFSLGGVTKGLGVYDHPTISAVAHCTTLKVDIRDVIAPKIDADIIMTHYPPSWRVLPFLLSLRLRNPKARLIHVEHSYSREWEQQHVPNQPRFRTMLRMAFGLFDRVVSVSHGQADWLREVTGIARQRIDVLYPYSGDQGLRAVAAPEYVDGDTLVIGAYGRMHDAKGFDRLINAIKALPDDSPVRLLLGGFGPEEVALKTLAGDHPRIRFAGMVTDVADFLGQCHVVAVPSRYEAYGQVAHEARRAARPILVSTAGGLPEQVGDCGWVIDCTDHDGLVKALANIPNCPLHAMSEAARRSTLDDDHCLPHSWVRLFQSLMAPEARSARHRCAA